MEPDPARRTAAAELGYWRWRFLRDAPGLARLDPVAHTAFRVSARAERALDLRVPPLDRDAAAWMDPGSYTATQALACGSFQYSWPFVQTYSVASRCVSGAAHSMQYRSFTAAILPVPCALRTAEGHGRGGPRAPARTSRSGHRRGAARPAGVRVGRRRR